MAKLWKKKINRDCVGNCNDKMIKSGEAMIMDLDPKQKMKIGNIIKKMIDMDKESQKLNKKEKIYHKKIDSLLKQNKYIVKQHSQLKSKFSEALKLVQTYQKKLNEVKSNKYTIKNKNSHNNDDLKSEINDLKKTIYNIQNEMKKNDNHSNHEINVNNKCLSRQSFIEISNDDNLQSNIEIPKPHPYPSKFGGKSKKVKSYAKSNDIDPDLQINKWFDDKYIICSNQSQQQSSKMDTNVSNIKHKCIEFDPSELKKLRKFRYMDSNTSSVNSSNNNNNSNNIDNENKIDIELPNNNIDKKDTHSKIKSNIVINEQQKSELKRLMAIQNNTYKKPKIIQSQPELQPNILDEILSNNNNNKDDRLSSYNNINFGLSLPTTGIYTSINIYPYI